jgi:uncharacterized protein YbjT (DUF2867 family)
VAVRDVARFAVRALTDALTSERAITLAGPGNYTNNQVAELYARMAGMPARIVHVPRELPAMLAGIVRPLHPGIARVMRISSLPDDAFSETVDLGGPCIVGPTTLEEFVAERVSEHRAR